VNWSFFQRKVVLTSDDVQWCLAQEEFVRVGLDNYLEFSALPIDDKEILGPHQSFSGSVRRILQDFLASDSQTLLLLEEDCIFRDLSHLEQAISELPAEWDILYLGANLICWNNGEQWPERVSEHLFRVYAAWTTHCIAFNRKVVPYLLEHQPGLNVQMFDNYLSTQLSQLNAYCIAPMVAYQRPRISSIWQKGEIDDYTELFQMSEERMK
jgi:hypothetical protein